MIDRDTLSDTEKVHAICVDSNLFFASEFELGIFEVCSIECLVYSCYNNLASVFTAGEHSPVAVLLGWEI